MINTLTTIKGTLILMSVMFGGGVICGSLGLVADAIGENTPVTLAVMGVAFSACWYLASTLQRLKDGQKITNQRLSSIESFLHIKSFTKPEEETSST